ncbi:MAG: S41 family peptidase [Chitinophagaceae bacterium]
MKLLQNGFTGICMFIIFVNHINAQPNTSFTRQEKTFITDKAIQLLKENYVFPNRVPEIEKYIAEKLATGGYDSLNNPEEFIEFLNKDLEQKGNDHHLDISYGPDRVKQIIAGNKNEQEGVEEKITKEWLQKIQYENFRLRKIERLDGNIGYFNFLNFTPLAPSKQSIAAAMNFLLYSNAIIIDLRENGGGYAETMNFMLSYFLKDSTPISTLIYRKENKVIISYTLKDSSIHKIPDYIPVYILVSHRTSSAAEGFAYTLQQYKRAVIIGEQTKGEGNPGRLFVINENLYIMIPTAEAISPVSRKSIDGTGVIPDIPINKNKALTKGLLEAYRSLAAKTDTPELKLLYQWQIPLLENELIPAPLTETIIAAITGDYEGGRKIIYESSSLFYINSIGEKEKLDYIGKGIFQNTVKSSLRLVMPFTDKPIPGFEWTWDDGGKPQKVKRILN